MAVRVRSTIGRCQPDSNVLCVPLLHEEHADMRIEERAHVIEQAPDGVVDPEPGIGNP